MVADQEQLIDNSRVSGKLRHRNIPQYIKSCDFTSNGILFFAPGGCSARFKHKSIKIIALGLTYR